MREKSAQLKGKARFRRRTSLALFRKICPRLFPAVKGRCRPPSRRATFAPLQMIILIKPIKSGPRRWWERRVTPEISICSRLWRKWRTKKEILMLLNNKIFRLIVNQLIFRPTLQYTTSSCADSIRYQFIWEIACVVWKVLQRQFIHSSNVQAALCTQKAHTTARNKSHFIPHTRR